MTAGRVIRRSRSASPSARYDDVPEMSRPQSALLDSLHAMLNEAGLAEGEPLETVRAIKHWAEEKEKEVLAAQTPVYMPTQRHMFESHHAANNVGQALTQAMVLMQPYQQQQAFDRGSHSGSTASSTASTPPPSLAGAAGELPVAAAYPAAASFKIGGSGTVQGADSVSGFVLQRATVHNPYDLAIPLQTVQKFVRSYTPLKASPLVFMTLTHDAIRSGMEKALELMSSPEGVLEGGKLFEQTSRLIDLHTKQEDEVFIPFLRKRLPNKIKMHDEHDEVSNKRKSLVAKVSRVGQGMDSSMLSQVRHLVDDYEKHMRGEEQELGPLISQLIQTDADVVHEAVQELIGHDLAELAAFAVPFTTFQLCRAAPYESIATYAASLRKNLSPEAYLSISKVMLMSAFQAKPQYAAKLVDDNILARDDANTLSPTASMLMSNGGAMPRTRKGVAAWLEKEQEAAWNWKDLDISREGSDVDALMRAERLHLKLAERFAEPLQLKHVMVEKNDDGNEQTIYFFIDNTWEMARRALFAKLYTRTHKERGRKLHVVIVDAKERRTLAKREGEMETPEAMSESLRRKPKPAAKGKKCSDEDSD